jgi:FkbM family methyltransferase
MIERVFHITLPQGADAERASIVTSIARYHPTWEIKVWQDPLEESKFVLGRYFSKCNSGAQLADLVRLDVLYKYGGVYIDSDVELLRSFDPLVEQFSFLIASEDGLLLTNAIIAAQKGHPAIKAIIDHLLEIEPDWSRPPNETTGPELYSQLLCGRDDITILPRETFYPYNWNQPPKVPPPACYAVHQWAGSWKSHNEDNETFRSSRFWLNLRTSLKSIGRSLIQISFREWDRVARIGVEASDRGSPHKFYPCANEMVIQTIHGFKIFVNGFDISVTPDLILEGTYEPAEEKFVARTLSGGDCFVDVGANVGIFTLLAAQKVGRFGRVIAFEPNRSVASLLAKSLVANWWHQRVEVKCCAVGDRQGHTRLLFSADNLGGARIEEGAHPSSVVEKVDRLLNSDQQQDVAVDRLDCLIPVDIPIKILKIDVEGNEGGVLRGAGRILHNKCIEYLMVEAIAEIAGQKWGDTLAEMNKLKELGYSVYKILLDGSLEEIGWATLDDEGKRTRTLVFRPKGFSAIGTE